MKDEDSTVYLYPTRQNNVITFPVIPKPVPEPTLETFPQVQMVEDGQAERPQLEQYIHDRFAREYNASINKFMPFLVKLNTNLQIYAALGFRTASNSRLFLETYLEQAIENELAAITGLEIRREKIIEVGNLAASKPGSSAPLFGAMACFLDRVGYEWAVICATTTVQNVFSKLQIPLIGLAEANAEALPEDQKPLWGSYYQTRPLVMAVHVKTAHRCIRESALGKRMLAAIHPSIDTMVDDWELSHA
jgi:hypothetical protein